MNANGNGCFSPSMVVVLLLFVLVLLVVVIPMNICWCCCYFCLRFSLQFFLCPPSSSCSLVALLLTLGLLGSVFVLHFALFFFYFVFFLSSFVFKYWWCCTRILGSFMVDSSHIIAAVSQDAQRRELTVCLFFPHCFKPLLFISSSLSLSHCLPLFLCHSWWH